jgi:hypothetical protein
LVKKKAKRDDEEQSKRFVEEAKRLHADETGQAFRRAFEKVVTPKKK